MLILLLLLKFNYYWKYKAKNMSYKFYKNKCLKTLYHFFLSFRLKVLSFMNSELILKNQRKFPHLSMLFYQKLSDWGTGTCDVAAVRRPSLSLVFYKEKCDKQST